MSQPRQHLVTYGRAVKSSRWKLGNPTVEQMFHGRVGDGLVQSESLRRYNAKEWLPLPESV